MKTSRSKTFIRKALRMHDSAYAMYNTAKPPFDLSVLYDSTLTPTARLLYMHLRTLPIENYVSVMELAEDLDIAYDQVKEDLQALYKSRLVIYSVKTYGMADLPLCSIFEDQTEKYVEGFP